MVELLEPEENITPEDEQFWGSLLDKVKKEEKGEQSHLLEVSVLCNQYMKTISKLVTGLSCLVLKLSDPMLIKPSPR